MTLSNIDRAASYAHRNPTDAQKESGNYRKGHVKFQGLDIAIENSRGSSRRGVGKDGSAWQVKMPAHYGYIKRTEGADGDHVDVYIGPHHKSPYVFVIDQIDADTGDYDEHKVMLGFGSKKQAENVYRAGFSDGKGKDRIGHVAEMSMDEFKHWLKDGDTTEPVEDKIKAREKIKPHVWGGKPRGPWDHRVHKADGGPVTDPDLLAQLNAPDDSGKVTDPALLAQLNAEGDNGSAKPLDNSSSDGWLSGAVKGLGTAAIKGLSNSVGTVGNLGKFADYALARADSAITGRPTEEILADYAKRRSATGVANAIDPSQVLPSGEDVYDPILKRTGEYKPTSEIGKLAQSGAETVAGAVGPGGGAAEAGRFGLRALEGAAKMAPANFVAGSSGQAATDATGDPLAGLAAGVITPTVGGAAPSKIRDASFNVARPFIEDVPGIGKNYAGQREQMVGEQLRDSAQNPDALDRSLFPGPMRPGDQLNTNIVPGSEPTLGQFSGDMGILQAERRARTDDNTPFNLRDAEQNAARASALQNAARPDADVMRPSQMLQDQLNGIHQSTETAVQRLQNGAQELAARLGPGASPEAIGASIRDAVEASRREAAAARSALYRAVDPDGSLALVASPIRDSAKEILSSSDPLGRPLEGDEARILTKAARIPDVVPYRSLLAFDQDVTTAMAQERRTAGQSVTWNRLKQLKGSVQKAIDDAVDNQAEYQAGAVARGEMAPEDTILNVLQNWQKNWYDRQAQARDVSEAGVGRNAGVGSASISSARGAARQTREQFGDVAGTSGLSDDAPITPNFDEAAAARLAAAKAGHAAYARMYREGPVGQALKTMGFADNYVVPNSGLPSRVVVRGDKGYETAKAFMKAAKNNPEAIEAIQDHILSPLRKSLNLDGTINSKKFASWKQDHAGALRAIDETVPGFSKRFDSAARATDILSEAGARAEHQVDEFQKSEAGKFLKLNDPREVENRAGLMLTDRAQGPTKMRSLVAKLRSDPSAIEGLRKAGVDWMARKFATTAEAATSGQKTLSSAAFRNFVRDNSPTLEALYPAEQVAMFRRIASDLDRANRSITATAIKGSPGSAKDVAPAVKKALDASNRHLSWLGAAMSGLYAGYHFGGLQGALAAAGAEAGGYLLGSLRAAGINRVEDMFRDALLNPERARYYLSKVQPAQPSEKPGYALSRAIRRGLVQTSATAKQ